MKSLDTLQPAYLRPPSRTAIRRVEQYGLDLESVIYETLGEFEPPVREKTVLLKPNFVGLDSGGATNTSPALVAATREAFLRLGARSVIVAEGSALERDSTAIAESLHLWDFMARSREAFVDLNTDEVCRVALRSKSSSLRELYLPRTVLRSDFIVSMPKLKTHRWAGLTLSLKNMFGIVPGNCYGWPKNVLHWAGISRAILDLNSTIRPDFAIVDGVVGMDGDGPLHGKAKPCGVVVMGDDPVAVDATCARIAGFAPERLDYLAHAGRLLGNLREENIRQIGETVESVQTPFAPPPRRNGSQACHLA
ncbi:MAG TPA: DUF362 domain-containing protein [Terriglobia bacterium]|nr:DUF362 domain-containing protein [Terriglobia bacterium]